MARLKPLFRFSKQPKFNYWLFAAVAFLLSAITGMSAVHAAYMPVAAGHNCGPTTPEPPPMMGDKSEPAAPEPPPSECGTLPKAVSDAPEQPPLLAAEPPPTPPQQEQPAQALPKAEVKHHGSKRKVALVVVKPADDATAPPPGHLADTAPPAKPSADDLPEPGHLTDSDGKVQDAKIQPAALQLEVLINGFRANIVAGFNKLPNGDLSSARSELRELGVLVPGKSRDDEQIPLNSLPGVTYKFDEPGLTIDIHLPDSLHAIKTYDVLPEAKMQKAEGSYGAVLNYDAFGAVNTNLGTANTNFSGASVNLDARAFSPSGVFRQTGSVGTTTFADATALRLDSTLVSANQERAEAYRAGDFISGGLDWTRPMRLGGLQAQRNFAMRPDLITSPITSMKGSAAVPSTVDVFINGARAYTEQVSPGPFEVNRLPVFSSQGNAQMVITDTSGRQTTVSTPIYSSPQLLAPTMFDYSVDMGLARMNYGYDSFDYGADPLLLASGRYGLNQFITAQGHLEAKPNLIDAGAGAIVQAGKLGTFNVAGAASDYNGDVGFYGFASWTWQYQNLALHASTARTVGNFNDLVSATSTQGQTPGAPNTAGTPVISSAVPIAVDTANANYTFQDMATSLNAGVIHNLTASQETTLATATISKTLRNRMSVFGTAYADLANIAAWGAGVGFSMPFGPAEQGITASTGASYDHGSGNAIVTASAVKPLDSNYGAYGWRVDTQYTNNPTTGVTSEALQSSGIYRGQHAIVSGDITGNATAISGDAHVQGSVVATKPGLFLGNPIQDSFAVVNAGVKDIDVLYENRLVGKTGENGTILLTDLQAWHPGKISIDPKGLPLNSDVSVTEKSVTPRMMTGVVVDFGVKKDSWSALLVLKNKDGSFVDAGTNITLEGQKEPFPMGYDGQVYLTGLQEKNVLTADIKGSACKINFGFAPDATKQVILGPFTCD